MSYAPVVLFTYNRLIETRKVITSLAENYLARESDLIIYSDGPKDEHSAMQVAALRAYLHTVSGFKSITIHESDVNKGLANSVIDGVTETFQYYDRLIVLEDDLQTTPNFLPFMNQGLDFYALHPAIFSISGYTMPLPGLQNHSGDYYLGWRASSWGWASWKDRWSEVDWEVRDYTSFKYNPIKNREFCRGGSDMSYMLWKQRRGYIDSWAIRWCYHQYKKNMLTVFPVVSKVINTGFGENGTNTKNETRFDTVPDFSNKTNFSFSDEIRLDKTLLHQFHQKFSLCGRIKHRLSRIFHSIIAGTGIFAGNFLCVMMCMEG